jgi:hypothetical protein
MAVYCVIGLCALDLALATWLLGGVVVVLVVMIRACIPVDVAIRSGLHSSITVVAALVVVCPILIIRPPAITCNLELASAKPTRKRYVQLSLGN